MRARALISSLNGVENRDHLLYRAVTDALRLSEALGLLAERDDRADIHSPHAPDADNRERERTCAGLEQHAVRSLLEAGDSHARVLLCEHRRHVRRVRALPEQIRVRVFDNQRTDLLFTAAQ